MNPAPAEFRNTLDWGPPPPGSYTAKFLSVGDPLLQGLVFMLQREVEGKDAANPSCAEVLAQSLLLYFINRYTAPRRSPREFSGGLSPYKLRRTLTYIKENLAKELSLVTLAAVAETSPFHFARSFKLTTGDTPHQYVIKCRMEWAKRLLTETDASLSEIGLQVGCADQSHFTALFRKYVSRTPKAYRDTTKMEFLLSSCSYPQATNDTGDVHPSLFGERRAFSL